MSGPSQNPIKRIIGEIHRRSLWQVLAIYVVASWAAFEVVQTLTEGLGLPGWLPGLAFVLLIIGLPVVLATAFVQEGGPTRSTPPSLSELDEIFSEGEGAPKAPASGLLALFIWRKAILAGMAAFALWGVVAAGWIAFDPEADGPSVGAAPPDDAVFIAVLPLEHRSRLESDRWFTEAVHDQLIGSLGRLSGMRVSSRTAVSRYADAELGPSEIGRELGVDYLVEGSVQRGGGRVLIASGLVHAATGQQVWYREFELWANSSPSREFNSAYRVFRLGQLSALMGRPARASAYGDSLLALAEPGLARVNALDLGTWQWPASWWKAHLARAYALVGRLDETLRWGERTMTDFRPRNDALDRHRLARFLLDAYLLADLREPALEMLRIVLSSPYYPTPALLATDPALRSMLNDPEVQALLDEYEQARW